MTAHPRRYVLPYRPEDSRIRLVVGGAACTGDRAGALPPEERALVRIWMESGAPAPPESEPAVDLGRPGGQELLRRIPRGAVDLRLRDLSPAIIGRVDDLPLRLDFGATTACAWLVDAADAGSRLDLFLAGRLGALSRSAVQRLIREGLVTVNGAPGRASTKVRAGDRVAARVPAIRPPGVDAQDLPLVVLLETASFAVLDKAAGMSVHPGRGRLEGTIANAIAHRWGLGGAGGGAHRPGIVHRLDLGTSGVMVVAKSEAAHAKLAAAFKARAVRKEYHALAFGDAAYDEQRIELPLGRDLVHKTRMAVRFDGGRAARTDVTVVERFGAATHFLCRPLTGRTHQIRVHLTSVGHPLLGDAVYAGNRPPPVGVARPMLHSALLAFPDPETGAIVEVAAPLPADFVAVIEALRGR